MKLTELAQEARLDLPALQQLRRELHQIPEFGLDLPKTQARLLAELDGLGSIVAGKALNSLVLRIEGAHPGPTILLRSDMDALKVVETSGESFASTNGFMHACGHDLHMTMGVEAARLLHRHRDQLHGNVDIWFQPGEEGHGGADVMIAEGALTAHGDKPIAAYGIHVFSTYPAGLFASRPGALMASAGDILVTFKGKGGHGSMPWLAKDPITPMLEAMNSIPALVTKHFSAFDPVIVNIGWVRAGDDATTNVVPETASFGATIRTFSHENFTAIRERLQELMQSTAHSHEVEVDVEFTPSSKVVLNDAAAVARVEHLLTEAFGGDSYLTLPQPIAGGEDFASILEEVPGAFIFLGAMPPEVDPEDAEANHSGKARFDDSVLATGGAVLAALAFDHLGA
jgi:hippurate hydrolase